MKRKLVVVSCMIVILLIFSFNLFSVTSFASPDPAEVKKIKSEAPLHLIGRVTSDELYQDITEQIGNTYQIRKMSIKVKKILIAPEEENSFNTLEVYYIYIPYWQANLYDGGKRMDIAVNDLIEIWLKEGEYGWESALWGNTVEHIEYDENRVEPIPEPYKQKEESKLNTFWSGNQEIIVLIGILTFSFMIILFSLAKQRRKEKFK